MSGPVQGHINLRIYINCYFVRIPIVKKYATCPTQCAKNKYQVKWRGGKVIFDADDEDEDELYAP